MRNAALVSILLWSVVIGLAYFGIVSQLRDRYPQGEDPIGIPTFLSLDPLVIDVLTLSNKALFDDFSLVWLLGVVKKNNQEALPEEFVTNAIYSVLRHNPRIESIYLLSCMLFSESLARHEECAAITKQGLEFFPGSWQLLVNQAFIHAFETKEPAQAAAYYLRASQIEGKPDWLERYAEKLLKEGRLTLEDYRASLDLFMDDPQKNVVRNVLKKYQVRVIKGDSSKETQSQMLRQPKE